MEPRVLIEEWSGICDAQAFVEETDTCTYFYIWFHPGKDNGFVKSCWVCNNSEATETLDLDAMESGRAPMMPASNVLHDRKGIHLQGDALEVVWFEEGDAAALLQGELLLCVIPAWSGRNGFHGYSRYAKETSELAWPLKNAENTLKQRIDKSRSFWNSFDQGGNFWREAQDMHMQVLHKFFGEHKKYYAIDGGQFPPKAYITGEKANVCYGITAGVSLMCMPEVELYYNENSQDFRRIELGFATIKEHEKLLEMMGSLISSLSNLPWRELSFLGHGHTIPFNNIKGYSAIWLLNAKMLPMIDSPVYPKVMGDDVNLLWLVPVTENEYKWLMEHSVEEALERCKNLETLVVFDGEGKLDENKNCNKGRFRFFKSGR